MGAVVNVDCIKHTQTMNISWKTKYKILTFKNIFLRNNFWKICDMYDNSS